MTLSCKHGLDLRDSRRAEYLLNDFLGGCIQDFLVNYPEEEKILYICGFGECMRGYFEAVTPDICFISRDDVNKMNSIVIQWGIDYLLKGGVAAKGRQYLIETKGKDDVYGKMARALPCSAMYWRCIL